MKPQLGTAIFLMIGLAVTTAGADELEKLVMPGPVIEGHAEIEAECSDCHVAFSRSRQRTLCLECHEDIAADIAGKSGFHGRDAAAVANACASCHTEHKGRTADVIQLDTRSFNHELTDFVLLGRHLETDCADCHPPTENYREAPTVCFDCHEKDDEHDGGLGRECADCHSPVDWQETQFDHEKQSGYALWGGHAEVTCTACHVSHRYENTPTECVACHRDDDPHTGSNGTDCAFCHTVRDWNELLFDHARETGFALLGRHAVAACNDCHTGNKFEQALETACIGCHLEDDTHNGLNGTECGDCHNSRDWTDSRFDHAVDTAFPLLGAHTSVACGDCHIQPVHEVQPPQNCIGCHADDDPHAGQLGEDCATCHGETDWTEDVAFEHDLTGFPLIGSHRQASCADCHETSRFHDAPVACVDCHREDDVHRASLGEDCVLCHNPNDWAFWRFDHDLQTRFPLDGAHSQLVCESCHNRPLKQQNLSFSECVACHRRDDVHRGEFGRDCGRCHDTRSFSGATL